MKNVIPKLSLLIFPVLCLLISTTCTKLEKEMLVSTGEITNVLTNTADVSGVVVDLGKGATQHGHCYGTTPNVTITSSKTDLGIPAGTGGFTSQLSNLMAGTKYYIKAYLTYGTETVYGNELNFTTRAASLPTIITTAITAITTSTATSGGNITSDGGSPVTARGVCWNTATGPSISNSKTTDGTGTNSFASNLSGLAANTLYYIRAYATNNEGTVYGNEIGFTTSAITLTVPGAPTIGTAVAGNAQATVTFTAPVSNGGSSLTGFTVTSSPGGLTGAGTASPITVTGLTNGTAYTFTVTATNAIGIGLASAASNSVTPSGPSTVPGAPTGVTATAGNAQATVTFTAPANNGGSAITGYLVTSSPGGFTGTGTTSPISVSGLTNGTAYTFTVTATNAIGSSSSGSASNSITPSTIPGAPTIGTAIKGNAQATVTFTAPVSNGGSVITGYTATSSPSGFTGTGSASPVTVTGLTNGIIYTFTVTAANAAGTGPASAASNSVTPSTVPDSPTIGTATAENAQASVTFTAPANNGGSAITSYTVTSNPGSLTGTGSSSPITVIGLSNWTAYTFKVSATNANGTGLSSSSSNSVIPLAPVTDGDGNLYNTIAIGAQIWMKENLKTTKYNDGTSIPNVTVNATWYGLTTAAYCWYNNDPTYKEPYGALYNWYAVDAASNGGKNVCPTGWHIPTDAELTSLTTYLGGESVAGGKLKEIGFTHWTSPNTGADNSSGFTALPGGIRYGDSGIFNNVGLSGMLWSGSVDASFAWYLQIFWDRIIVYRSSYYMKGGFSVRCLKD